MKNLLMVALCLSVGVGAVACLSDGQEAVISAESAFEGCDGYEKPYHLAWSTCMEKMGDDRWRVLERCQGYAKALVCHKPPPLPPCKCEADKKALKHCEDKRSALKNCYNWDGFIENCEGFASGSEILCEGFSKPQDVCTPENWKSYLATRKYGTVEMP